MPKRSCTTKYFLFVFMTLNIWHSMCFEFSTRSIGSMPVIEHAVHLGNGVLT